MKMGQAAAIGSSPSRATHSQLPKAVLSKLSMRAYENSLTKMPREQELRLQQEVKSIGALAMLSERRHLSQESLSLRLRQTQVAVIIKPPTGRGRASWPHPGAVWGSKITSSSAPQFVAGVSDR